MRIIIRSLIAIFIVLSFAACSKGGGGKKPEPTKPFDMIVGDWTVRLNEPFTSCSVLDLSEYSGTGRDDNWRFDNETIGSFKYVNITHLDGSGQSKFTVTDSGDPFVIERVSNYEYGECKWTDTSTYELTFLSGDHVYGIHKTDVTSSYCEECYWTLRYEMKRGVYKSIDEAPF